MAGAAETIGAESLSGRESRVEIVDGRSYASGIEHDQRTGNLAMSSSLFGVRLSDAERALLEAAASQAGTNVSDFVRRRAIEAAEIDVLERANRANVMMEATLRCRGAPSALCFFWHGIWTTQGR